MLEAYSRNDLTILDQFNEGSSTSWCRFPRPFQEPIVMEALTMNAQSLLLLERTKLTRILASTPPTSLKCL